ncbi:MAG: PH domain-containing protein [Marinifilaceae bacterium]
MTIFKSVYRTRISVLLTLVILGIFGIIVLLDGKPINIPMLCTLGIIFLITMLFLSGTRYVIADNNLHIKLWFLSMGTVNLQEIGLVKRSYNPLSSPASSLKRLALYKYGHGNFPYALISPIREDEFLKELKRINPKISIHVPQSGGVLRIWDWDI